MDSIKTQANFNEWVDLDTGKQYDELKEQYSKMEASLKAELQLKEQVINDFTKDILDTTRECNLLREQYSKIEASLKAELLLKEQVINDFTKDVLDTTWECNSLKADLLLKERIINDFTKNIKIMDERLEHSNQQVAIMKHTCDLLTEKSNKEIDIINNLNLDLKVANDIANDNSQTYETSDKKDVIIFNLNLNLKIANSKIETLENTIIKTRNIKRDGIVEKIDNIVDALKRIEDENKSIYTNTADTLKRMEDESKSIYIHTADTLKRIEDGNKSIKKNVSKIFETDTKNLSNDTDVLPKSSAETGTGKEKKKKKLSTDPMRFTRIKADMNVNSVAGATMTTKPSAVIPATTVIVVPTTVTAAKPSVIPTTAVIPTTVAVAKPSTAPTTTAISTTVAAAKSSAVPATNSWRFFDDAKKGNWIKYSNDINNIINKEIASGKMQFQINCNGNLYDINRRALTQTNTATGKVRRMRQENNKEYLYLINGFYHTYDYATSLLIDSAFECKIRAIQFDIKGKQYEIDTLNMTQREIITGSICKIVAV
jgi:hypothetical protein